MGSCIFSYYISKTDVTLRELTNRYRFGNYTVLTDPRTPYISAGNENSECAIFGFAVNVITGESEGLVEKIISFCSGISDVIAFEKELGGKYLILYRDKEQYYALCDATGSIPVFYISEDFACTSNFQYLVDQYGYIPDEEFDRIRNSSEISQAMPYDITRYREIKCMIPNHFLSFNKRVAIRFTNSKCAQQTLTVEEATNMVLPMIDVINEYYKSLFNVYCPITAGRDSRVVLAFLAGNDTSVQCYTIRHPEHCGNEQDLVIPKQLCLENKMPYEQIRDVEVSKDLKKEMDVLLGKNNYSNRTLRTVQTIWEHYGDGAIFNGDIIDQVGKCSAHRDIPLFFATPRYFRCKLHNYSREAMKQLRLWMEEIKNSGEGVDIFDLFSVENRMGRWAGQTNLICNSLGQMYLNIFNSRSIIYVWTAVRRKDRKKSSIHLNLIKNKMPSLLEIPFESDKNVFIRLSKINGITYLLGSYAKYYMERFKLKRDN